MRASGRTRLSGCARWNPDSLSGNRRSTRDERVEHEEAGGLLRAEAGADTIREGAANGFLMEVCVDSVESAVNAERGGAGRIELCSGLLEGGTTPSMGVLQVVKQYVQIPVFVMIRPRGGDFLYSDREVEVMKADIRLAKLYGADGLVFGALTEDGHIDKELCMSLVALCRPLPVTFHRAFDMVHDPVAALETLLTLGFERVLTSGCDSSALEGLPLIKRLIDQAKGRIVVMPGGGITDRNLQRILEGSGATEFHCSARSARDSGMKFRNSSVAMGASLSNSEYSLKVTDVTQVRTLNAIAKNILV
uniref:Copper homeostasis protein cutC homolog n=1 Tax=Bos taurus TaxID=9913 RepID=H7BWV5_BOVIN